MGISGIIQKMIDFYEGNLHDIDHFLKVWSYAKLIGEQEGLDSETQRVLEIAAVVHDIACPLCRRKYGQADGKHQELEGGALATEFLQGSGLSDAEIARVAYLVAHHHTVDAIDGADYQILIEADYIVNAGESAYSTANIVRFDREYVKTGTAHALLHSIFKIGE
ncbi:MAG: HD domain-containing protein [Clostridia bacterium]|nr:HD domain-containing protein [Clostridia bacterium]